MSDTTPYSVPKEPGRWRAITLAVVMHAALLAFLWIGIRWQSQTPVAIEAEVWSLQPKEAAPKPQPEPEVKPEPKPAPEKPVAAQPPQVKPPLVKPDIALEQEKKHKVLLEHKRQEEQAAKEKKEKEELVRIEKEKQAEKLKEKLKQEQLAKKEADERLKKKTEEAKKKHEQELKDKQLADKLRAEDMKRMTAGTGGSGDAPKTQGSRGDAGYASKLAAKIRSNTVFIAPNDVAGNPAVEYDVKLFPDGTLRGTPRKIKSSGVPGFDDAVLRAIELSQPFPPDKSGAVPSGFPVIHHLKEQ